MTDISGVPSDGGGSLPPDAELPTRLGRVLVVCTGNVCRSPYMERRLMQALAETGVEVVSAGTDALVGEGIDLSSVELLQKMGADPDHFAATQLTAQIVADADLVLTASRAQRGEVVKLHPKALRYTFTWSDFADLVEALDPTGLGRPGTNPTWVAHVGALAAARRGTIPPRSREESDIVDPYGQEIDKFSLMAEQIHKGLPSIVAALSPR